MQAYVWSDYLCPWCYVGLDRTARLERLGVAVTPRPFELHPEIPAEGVSLREGRGRRLYDRIAAECEAAGLEFRRPERIPNSRLALEVAEWVRREAPPAFAALHQELFRAAFVERLDIGDRDVVAALVTAAGAEGAAAMAAVDRGELRAAVDAAREEAFDHGIAATPAWLLDGRLVIAGVQPPELYERMVARLLARR